MQTEIYYQNSQFFYPSELFTLDHTFMRHPVVISGNVCSKKTVTQLLLYIYSKQGTSCKDACADAHLRCAVARVGVCAKSNEKCAGCACMRLVIWRAMCDRTFAHFWNIIARKCYSRISHSFLEHHFLL